MIDRHEERGQLDHPNRLEERLLRGLKVWGHRLRLQRLEMEPLVIHPHLPGLNGFRQRREAGLQGRQELGRVAGALHRYAQVRVPSTALGRPFRVGDEQRIALAIGEAMPHPDGTIAQRFAEGKQGRGFKRPQGSLAVDPLDERGPAGGQARVDIRRQLPGLVDIALPESCQRQEQGRLCLAIKCEPHKCLQERPDLPCVRTELPADGCSTAREEGVRRRHAGHKCRAECPIWDRGVTEHPLHGTQRLAQGLCPAPLGVPDVLSRASVEVLDEPIGHGQNHIGALQ